MVGPVVHDIAQVVEACALDWLGLKEVVESLDLGPESQLLKRQYRLHSAPPLSIVFQTTLLTK